MATFKLEYPYRRKDGSRAIRVRINHGGKEARIASGIIAGEGDFTRGGKLKNPALLVACDDLVKRCRQACNEIGPALPGLDATALARAIVARLTGGDAFRLDFIAFTRKVAATRSAGTGKLYASAINALARYTGRDSLDIGEVNAPLVQGFIDFLASEPSRRSGATGDAKRGRAVSLYIACLKAAHNEAKRAYNDEGAGIIRVPLSPFRDRRLPVERIPVKRAVSLEVLQRVIDDRKLSGVESIARDAFLLSFALLGMNSVDLWACPSPVNGVISYNRAKTRSRRADGAPVKVRVEGCINELVEARRGKSRFAFNFRERYARPDTFNHAINDGLKKIGERAGVPGLTFYAARHSWATIARSSLVKADKATVHEALCHADPATRITDAYIDQDWSVVWEVNSKVTGLLDWYSIL